MILGEPARVNRYCGPKFRMLPLPESGEVEGAGALAHLLDELRIDLIGESPLTAQTYGLNSSSDSNREIVPLYGTLVSTAGKIGGSQCAHEQRVAVLRGGLHRHRANRSRGADAVHDHDRLIVEVFLRMLRENSAC